jgi:excisionase family DNA binding protein
MERVFPRTNKYQNFHLPGFTNGGLKFGISEGTFKKVSELGLTFTPPHFRISEGSILNSFQKEVYMAHYTSLDQLPLALSADDVAEVLGISRANAYNLMRSKSFPTLKIGKRMTVPKDKLIEWIEQQINRS